MATYQQPCSACIGVIGTSERSIARHERRAAEARIDADVAEKDATTERANAYGLGTHKCLDDCTKRSHLKEAEGFDVLADRLRRQAAREFVRADIDRERLSIAQERIGLGGCLLCGDKRYLSGSDRAPFVRIEQREVETTDGYVVRGVVVPVSA